MVPVVPAHRPDHRIMNKIKTKIGVAKINLKVMTDCFEVIGDSLTDFINLSLTSGVVPDKWKSSTVIPIPKLTKTIKCEE
jgi:hypothetical protein